MIEPLLIEMGIGWTRDPKDRTKLTSAKISDYVAEIERLRRSSDSTDAGKARAKLAPGPWKIEPHRDNPYNCHVVDANGQNVLVNCGRAFAEWIIAADALSTVSSTHSNTVAEPSRCKNPVARGESKEADASTGDAPVASASTLSVTSTDQREGGK